MKCWLDGMRYLGDVSKRRRQEREFAHLTRGQLFVVSFLSFCVVAAVGTAFEAAVWPLGARRETAVRQAVLKILG